MIRKDTLERIFWRVIVLITLLCILIPVVLTIILSRDYQRAIGNPKRYFDFDVMPVTSRSDDVILSGWFVPATGKDIGVLMLHGIGADRTQMVDQTTFLHRLGYPVLLFDLRNHGESDEATTTYGWNERWDAAAMAAELRRHSGVDKVVLWGISMGAATALMAAPEIEGIAGVIAESPFDSMRNTFNHHNKLYFHLPQYPFVPMTLGLLGLLGGYDVDQVSPIQAVSRSGHIPMLFVAGRDDKRMRPDLVAAIAAAHPGPSEFWVGHGSHAIVFQSSRAAYKERVFEFLKRVEKGR